MKTLLREGEQHDLGWVPTPLGSGYERKRQNATRSPAGLRGHQKSIRVR